jgi:ADP-ribose pyrophosphatase YjhB (NUDIX family)
MSSRAERVAFEKSLNRYAPLDLKEIAFKERMLSLLAYDNCFERSLLHAHFTGSAWVVDPQRDLALLTHHAKLDKWLQLGGHADGESNLQKVASRELTEESGSTHFEMLSNQIFDIDIHTIPAKGEIPEHDHYDVRYFFIGDASLGLVRNHESKELRWVAFSELFELTNGNISIQRMLNKTVEMAL